jgi:hypothetical protein
MTLSTLDLAGARTAMTRQLMDAGLAVWGNDQFDQGLRLALVELGQSRPRRMWWAGTTTFDGSTRWLEVGWLAAYRGAVIRGVWAPYDATLAFPRGLNGAREVGFNLFTDGVDAPGVPTVQLDEYIEVNSVTAKFIIQFDYPVWLLKDLDAAAATTFMADVDHWLVLGACGHVCMMRAVDLAEDVGAGVVTSLGGGADVGAATARGGSGGNARVRVMGGTQTYAAMSGKTGNYGAVGALWLKQYRDWLTPASRPRGAAFRERSRADAGFYDASRLGVV